MTTVKERIDAYCYLSGEDLFLCGEHYANGKSNYSRWIKASDWDWSIHPNHRLIMANEIVLETDYTEPENKEYTQQIIKILSKKGIDYWIYFTSSKSYHVHFIIQGLEKYEDGKERQQIKETICETLLGEELYSKIDQNNLHPKKLIRIEGSINPKTKKEVSLYTKQKFLIDQELLSTELITIALEKIKRKNINKIDETYVRQINTLSNNKVYCMLMEDALKNKWPQGGRHMNLCPNAVAILDSSDLVKLHNIQYMDMSEFEGWIKKKPQFNCVQFRRYGATIGKKDICKECFKKSFNKNNW